MAEGGSGSGSGGGRGDKFSSKKSEYGGGSSVSSCWTSASMAYDRRYGRIPHPLTPITGSSWGSQISENYRRNTEVRQRMIQEHADQAAAARYGYPLQQDEANEYLRQERAKARALEISAAKILHFGRLSGGGEVGVVDPFAKALAEADARRREHQFYPEAEEENEEEQVEGVGVGVDEVLTTQEEQLGGVWRHPRKKQPIPFVMGEIIPPNKGGISLPESQVAPPQQPPKVVSRIKKMSFAELEDVEMREKKMRGGGPSRRKRMDEDEDAERVRMRWIREERARLSEEERQLEEKLAALKINTPPDK